MRPKRVPGEDYEQAMRLYQAEIEKRFALVPPTDPSVFQEYETDDDYMSDEETDDDADEYETDGDDDLPYNFEENPMKQMNYTVQAVSKVELYERMPDDCCFCMEEVSHANAVTTNCGHSFCVSCFTSYRKRTCPCCRHYVDKLTTYNTLRSVEDNNYKNDV
jgi:hypothetical protein